MDKPVQIRIENKETQSADVHSFVDLDNARDFLTDRIRAERKKKKAEEQINAVPGE